MWLGYIAATAALLWWLKTRPATCRGCGHTYKDRAAVRRHKRKAHTS